MTRDAIERCNAYAVITIDRRGTIRQQAAATRADALAKAKELAALLSEGAAGLRINGTSDIIAGK